jgi:glycolate oxidase FAD binding subunit
VRAWRDIVGAEHATRGGPADAVDGVVPAWVVRPGSVEEVQACVRAAGREGAALVAQGRGGHMDIGAPPVRIDVLLALDRLDRVLAHEAGDMTVTVEAGCRLPTLGAALATAGQWLPLDPPRPEATTAGGLLAANLAGPLRASQGLARDLLLGLRVVGADGGLVRGGGRVVKNVAGYDLPKLHVGAFGTVGVIVEATFRVRPRPEREEAVVVACRGIGAAASAARALRESALVPLWLEVVGPGVVGEGAALAVGLGGFAEEVGAAHAGVVDATRAYGDALHVVDGAGLRARLAAAPLLPGATVLRAATLPAEVGRVMEAMVRAGATSSVAHAANGVVRAAVVDPGCVAPVLRSLRPGLEARGGSLLVERAPAAVKAGLDVWGDPGPGFDLMRRLKRAFDPSALFAPGRFVGGL